MRVDFYGLVFETPKVTVYLWSPWRASALEHRLFEAVHGLPGLRTVQEADEMHVEITDAKTWRSALQGVCRVIKGWQEEADPGTERRAWRWLLEADTDDMVTTIRTSPPACGPSCASPSSAAAPMKPTNPKKSISTA